MTNNLCGCVGLYFVVKGRLLFHKCTLEKAEVYGSFLNYPYSHDSVWQSLYRRLYGVDFDYYPRGRVIYNKDLGEYLIYYDRCAEKQAMELAENYCGCKTVLCRDEHYSCRFCRDDYENIAGKQQSR